ncbi:MAG: hypothetical protein KKF44_09950 [Nanoarchaeota archaeon]|nr:hypothetical protein [Nanoarchaeota archaeon]
MRKIGFIMIFIIIMAIHQASGIDRFDAPLYLDDIEALQRMDDYIKDINNLGYDSARFTDIRDQAEVHLQSDNGDSFSNSEEKFRNTSEMLVNSIKSYDMNRIRISDLSDIVSDTDPDLTMRLNLAQGEIKEGKYEDAMNSLSEISDLIKTIIEPNFADTYAHLEETEKMLREHELDNKIIPEQRIELTAAEKDMDISGLISVVNQIQIIRDSVERLDAISSIIEDLKMKNIDPTKILDINDQARYYIENNRFDRIEALFSQADHISANIREAEQKAALIREKINHLEKQGSAEDDIKYFEKSLSEVQLMIRASLYDDAITELEALDGKLMDFESQMIAGSGIKKSQVSIADFLTANAASIFVGIVILVVSGMISKNSIVSMIKKKQMADTKKEIDRNVVLIKELQKKYFIDKSIPKKRYYIELDTHQRNLASSTKRLAILKHRK